MNKEKEFLNKLADLLEEYKVEIENDYDFVGYNEVKKYIDFDFQEPPYTTVTFEEVYIDCQDIREKAKEI